MSCQRLNAPAGRDERKEGFSRLNYSRLLKGFSGGRSHRLCHATLEAKANPETALPVMSREAAGLERRHELGCANCPPRIVDDTVAEIESEYKTTRGVVFNDAAKIDVGFCTSCPFCREEAAAWFLNAEWITAKMNEARPSLEEDSYFFPAFSSLQTKKRLQMISTGSGVPRQEIDFSFEI